MISRYSRPVMEAIWTDQAKYENWLKVEIAVCEAWAKEGRIPKEAVSVIKEKALLFKYQKGELQLPLQSYLVFLTTLKKIPNNKSSDRYFFFIASLALEEEACSGLAIL